MPTRFFLLILTPCLLNSIAQAHDLKIFASQQAISELGTKTTFYLAWGHRVPVDELIEGSTLSRYELVSPTNEKSPLKAEGLSLQANAVEMKSAGVWQAVVDRKPSVFTYVIDKEGERQLKRGGKSQITEGKIDLATKSVMCGKALVVVGKSSEELPKATGQAIEFVPLDPPTKWNANTDIRFQLLIHGKPVTTEFPIVEARPVGFKPDHAWSFASTVNKKGEFTLRPDKAGTWILKVNVKRKATEADQKEFDVESFTGTLTFEVGP
jgi:uncharacterized GH25 family protein